LKFAVPDDLDKVVKQLASRMARAEAVLFTGAGFSWDAKDEDGRPIPQVDDLKKEIWESTWPREPVESQSTLADTYAAALAEGRNRLTRLMKKRLKVSPESVTEWHRTWLSMPWRRAYTVNIDDLEWAAGRVFPLPRRIRPHSALRGSLPLGGFTYISTARLMTCPTSPFRSTIRISPRP
jgi:NAD-dependent SIR2 family protein deacetylase